MPDPLPLHDGGAFYHGARPLGLPPALRAAAQLLVAGERRVPGLREELREEFVGGPEIRLAVLSAPSVWFDPEHGFRLLRGLYCQDGRRRQTMRLRPANRVAAWARERYLNSPWVVELILLTVASWQELRRRSRAVEGRLAALTEADGGDPDLISRLTSEASRLTRAADGWGPWIEVLTRPPEEADLGLLIDLPHVQDLPYLYRAQRPAPAGSVVLELDGWRFELETWEEAVGRLRSEVEQKLERYRDDAMHRAQETGFMPNPSKSAVHHFDWLALRQLEGWSPAQLAAEFRVGASTVHAGLQQLSDLLELELRPVPRGPTPRC